jgi:hypothetical protein
MSVSLVIILFEMAYKSFNRVFDTVSALSIKGSYIGFGSCFYYMIWNGYHSRDFYFAMSLYLPFIAILLHALLWFVASTGLARICPKIVGHMAVEVDFWLRSGRTIFSVPLALLMLLPVYFQIFFIRYDFQYLSRASSYLTTIEWYSEVFWKDPLEDQLYII